MVKRLGTCLDTIAGLWVRKIIDTALLDGHKKLTTGTRSNANSEERRIYSAALSGTFAYRLHCMYDYDTKAHHYLAHRLWLANVKATDYIARLYDAEKLTHTSIR